MPGMRTTVVLVIAFQTTAPPNVPEAIRQKLRQYHPSVVERARATAGRGFGKAKARRLLRESDQWRRLCRKAYRPDCRLFLDLSKPRRPPLPPRSNGPGM